MRMSPLKRTEREPTIALINIVFLMLVFFMIAGTLAPAMDPKVTLVDTRDLDGSTPPDALVVRADGTMTYRGNPVRDLPSYLSQLSEDEMQVMRLVPDRDLPARDLVRLGNDLRAAGAQKVRLVTSKALQ